MTFFLRLYLVDEYSLVSTFLTYEHVALIGRLTLTIRKNIVTTKASTSLSLSDESYTATIIPVANATKTAITINKTKNFTQLDSLQTIKNPEQRTKN